MQPVRPADPGGKTVGETGRADARGRPHHDRLQAGLPGKRDRVRRSQRSQQRSGQAAAQPQALPGARRARHAAECRLSDAREECASRRAGAAMSSTAIPSLRPVPALRPSARPVAGDAGDAALREITDDVMRPLVTRPGAGWWACFAASTIALTIGVAMVAYEIATGSGVWGLNRTVGWAFDITNFVFWIGIGHAGTLISAILLLLRQKWRTSINRSAEAMTLFAVICAAIFPGVHVGRVWMAWYLAPVPNNWAIWPNFLSPLMWD